MPTQHTRLTDEERFWTHVRKTDGCWEWTASRKSSGYGQFCVVVNGKMTAQSAHRWIDEQRHGPVPKGIDVCHHCDNRICVRDEHLFRGTRHDNMLDMLGKGRATTGARSAAHLYPERRPRGSAHGGAHITEADVVEIRRRRAQGELLKSLAADFGIDVSQIAKIAKRLVWTHVP